MELARVLVTGASGFIGRYTIAELLRQSQGSDAGIIEFAVSYDQVVAVDICNAEIISERCGSSPRVLPLEFDLEWLLQPNRAFETNSFVALLKTVSCVVHIAGIVDTRESAPIADRLNRVNFLASAELARLAAAAGVKRFVLLSSAAAIIRRRDENTFTRFLASLLLEKSMLGSLSQSSYGKSKLGAERAVSSHGSAAGMRVCIVRPHVVWGRGDSLSTELLLGWPDMAPTILIGDCDTRVVSVRADNLARYIILADAALLSGRAESGVSFDVGDEAVSLRQLNERIVRCKCVSGKSVEHALDASNRCRHCIRDDRPSAPSAPPVVVPLLVLIALLFVWETLESLWKGFRSASFRRLLTANNAAYCDRSIVVMPMLDTFSSDRRRLFALSCRDVAAGNRADDDEEEAFVHSTRFRFHRFLSASPCDHIALSADYLRHRLASSAAPASLFSLPLKEARLATPVDIGPLTLPNRVIKAATFECMADPRGAPTEELSRFHTRTAAGGAALTVVAYASVSRDGRSFPTQICLDSPDAAVAQETEHALRRLCESVHRARPGAAVALQLTHAGAFADPLCNRGSPAVGPSRILNPLTLKYSLSLQERLGEMRRIESDFVNAVDFCKRTGFDAVEVHLGHGYLLSQFLSRRTNPEFRDQPEKRLEFPLRVLKAVCDRAHSAAGPGEKRLAVIVKFNVSEQRESDLTLSDARLFARAFLDAGADLLLPSGGHVMVNGLHMLRGGRPLAEMARAQQNWFKKLFIASLGSFFIEKEPFREGFFRERVISVMLGAGVPLDRVCLVGGVHEARTAECAVRYTGFACIQLGRVLLADLDWCIKVGACTPQVPIRSIASGPSIKSAKAAEADECNSLRNQGKTDDEEIRRKPIRVCDNSNECIVGATMALQPLKCSKYHCGEGGAEW
jgi:2,4-dienoyl-CoA reductase-like NADH-dependent reductase (Old Yellow Enzyme family)/nucleoside-diphosphate-sugar epimerase